MMIGQSCFGGERFSTNVASSAHFVHDFAQKISQTRWAFEPVVAEEGVVSPALFHLRLLRWAQMDEEMTGQVCLLDEFLFANGAVVGLPKYVRVDWRGR